MKKVLQLILLVSSFALGQIDVVRVKQDTNKAHSSNYGSLDTVHNKSREWFYRPLRLDSGLVSTTVLIDTPSLKAVRHITSGYGWTATRYNNYDFQGASDTSVLVNKAGAQVIDGVKYHTGINTFTDSANLAKIKMIAGADRTIANNDRSGTGNGYDLSVIAGRSSQSTASAVGGDLFLRGGDGDVDGTGGNVYIFGGTSGASTYGNSYLGHDGSAARGSTILGTITTGTWQGTSIDTAYTNAVSGIDAGYGLDITSNGGKRYKATVDTTNEIPTLYDVSQKLNISDTTKVAAGTYTTVSYAGHTATVNADTANGGLAVKEAVNVFTEDNHFAKTFTDSSVHDYAVVGREEIEGQGVFLASSHRNGTTSLYIHVSNDGKTWSPISSSSLYTPNYGTLRDPSILYHNGKYYVAHTMNAFAGENRIAIIVSTDLINWDSLTSVTVYPSATNHRVWAPEWFKDDDGSVILLFAQDTSTQATFKIWYVAATNTELTSWGSADSISISGGRKSMIDPFLIKENGTYYLWYTWGDTNYVEYASSASKLSGYTRAVDGDFAGWGKVLEGESLVKLNDSTWRIYLNDIEPPSYLIDTIFYSESYDNFATWTTKSAIKAPMLNMEHPTVVRIRDVGVFRNIVSSSVSSGGIWGSNGNGNALLWFGGTTPTSADFNTASITNASSGTFSSYLQSTTGKFTDLNSNTVPYHLSDASGLTNSPITISSGGDAVTIADSLTAGTATLNGALSIGTNAITSVGDVTSSGKIDINGSGSSFYVPSSNSNYETQGVHVGNDAEGLWFGNTTGVGYIPLIRGLSSNTADKQGLYIVAMINSAQDSGAVSAFSVSARLSTNTVIANRPLFEVLNYATQKFVIAANGDVTVSSGNLTVNGTDTHTFAGEVQTATVRGSDTVKAGTKTGSTYSYFIPGGALVQSSDSTSKTGIKNFTANLANFSSVTPRNYKFKKENFIIPFDEKSVPDSVDVRIDSITTKRVSNKTKKDSIRTEFIRKNDEDATRLSSVEHAGFLAQEFNRKILGKNSNEIRQEDVINVMWAKIQELEAEIKLLKKK